MFFRHFDLNLGIFPLNLYNMLETFYGCEYFPNK